MMMMSKDLERQHIEDLPVEKNPIARRKQATGRGFTATRVYSPPDDCFFQIRTCTYSAATRPQ